MKRHALLLVVLLLAAVLGVVWLLLDPGAKTVDPGVPTTDATAGDAHSSELSDATPHAATSDARTASAPLARDPAPVSGAVLPPRDAFEFRVVRHEDGVPVPKATVRWMTAPSTPDGFWRDAGRVLAEIEEHGQRAEADDEGRFRLDRIESSVVVVAEHDGRTGWAAVTRASLSPQYIEIVPDRTLRVQVVDSRAFPCAGVPVALRTRAAYDQDDVVRIVTREPDGVAEIQHAGMLLALVTFPQYSVAIAGALEPPVEVPVEPGAIPKDTVRLTLPPTGEVEVWLRRKDGRVYTDPVEVGLYCSRPESPDPRRIQRDHTRSTLRVTSVGGRAHFPYVSLNTALEASAIRPGRESECRVQGVGPREPGERTTLLLDVDVDPLVPTIEGRAVDEARRPIASTRLIARTYTGTPPVATRRAVLHTDVEGRFQLDIHDEHFGDGPLRLLVCDASDEWDIRRGAEVPLPKELPVGVIPIGDVVLESGRVLVDGRVVDGSGAPIAGAAVSLRVRDAGYGVTTEGLRDATDDFGRFEIRGWIETGRLTLRAAKTGHGTEVVDVEHGTKGLDIVLRAAGSIAGSVRLPSGFPREYLQVHCSHADGASLAFDGPPQFRLQADGSFLVPQLKPGSYRVQLKLQAEPNPLVDAAGVTVRGGEVSADPRLQAIDLRTKLHRFELLVRTHDGRPPPEFETYARRAGTSEEPRYDFFQNGRATFVATAESLDVTVVADGYRTTQVAGLTGSRELVLQPGIEVELVLTGATPPREPFHLQPILVAQDGSDEEAGWGAPPIGANGRARRRVPAPGKYAVHFGIQTGELFRGETWVEVATEPTIVVKDVSDVQTIEVALDPKALEGALPRPPAPPK